MAERSRERQRLVVASLALALSAGLTGGCVRRDVPYRFRGPLVGAVEPGLRPSGPLTSDGPARSPAPGMAAPPVTRAAVELARRPPRRVVLARPRRQDGVTDGIAATLRAQVGRRRSDGSVGFTLAMLVKMPSDGASPDDGIDRDDADIVLDAAVARLSGPSALLALARERDAVRDAAIPRPGDILVFGPLGQPSDFVALAVGTAPRGTIEFVYLQRGVVRRGFVTPERPDALRDDDLTVLNTFVRGSDGADPRGTRYLAGQLLISVVDRARLLGPPPRLADARADREAARP